ncbi:PilN domain-containing protein [Thiohalobacter sp.]|uniref:PilN domain-containing protein n=1 Tax=Thiohalobacter sp. TaxID=2025948 RepID=UPI0026075A7E|nr:PilN domain-containing protein [Thiohalobacter sp.]
MQQQVNLYQPVFRREQHLLSGRTLMQILALAVLALGLWAVAASFQATRAAHSAATLAQAYERQAAGLARLVDPEARARLAGLDREIERLERQLAEGKRLLTAIDTLVVPGQGGFSPRLEALARHRLPGLWLTGIRLQSGGGTRLSGMTLDPRLVPRYLELLNQDPRLAASPLSQVRMNRAGEDPRALHFVLGGAGEGEAS